jgi:hypothetical protein
MKGNTFMKLDIVRTEQLNTLSVNPVSELSDREMESIYGGQGAAGFGASGSLAEATRIHSTSFFCDRNTFSINTKRTSTGEIGDVWAEVVPEIALIDIGNPVNQVCANND